MTAIRCGIKDNVIWPPLDPAIQNRLQRFVMFIIMRKAEIITEQHKAMVAATKMVQQASNGWQIFALKFHDFQGMALRIHRAVNRLNQGRFAHAPRAPQQGVVGRISFGKLQGVLHQCIA